MLTGEAIRLGLRQELNHELIDSLLSPSRQLMIDDMRMRKFNGKT